MTKQELLSNTKEKNRKVIDQLWSVLWDGSASNAYVSVDVLGVSLEKLKDTFAKAATESELFAQIFARNELWLHKNSLSDDGCIQMAYQKGTTDFSEIVSSLFPGKLVVCECSGWYGSDYCEVSIDGREAVPGEDYEGCMEYAVDSDYEFDEDWDELDEEEQYYDISLTITDKEGNSTCVGGGMISYDDVDGYKAWANKVKEVDSITWGDNEEDREME